MDKHSTDTLAILAWWGMAVGLFYLDYRIWKRTRELREVRRVFHGEQATA